MKHFNTKKIAAALMLVAVSLLGALPLGAFASSSPLPAAGDGNGDKPEYVIGFSKPVVTDVSQLYTNAQAPSTQQPTDLLHLIDNDSQTLFHTAYYSETEITDYHYIRVYADRGLPDKFVIRWWRRNESSYENNRACRPSKIEIAVSNDGENWENKQILTTEDGLPTEYDDMEYISREPISGKGYKYFIMKVLEVNDDWGMSDGWGHPFFTMSQFNLFPAIYDGSESMADFIGSMKYGPSDFRLSGDPGCMGDEKVAAEFEDAYFTANQFVDEEHSAEEAAALKARLEKAMQAALDAIVPIEENKYYYITTGYDAFVDGGKEMYGWCLPYDNSNKVGWKKIDESGRFVWKFTKNDDGSYNIQNLLTGYYMDRSVSNNTSQPAVYSETPNTKQFVKLLNFSGNYNIFFENAVEVYHQENHQSGAGEQGMIVNWNGGIATASTWYIRAVPADVAERIDAIHNREMLDIYLNANPNLMESYKVGTKAGQLKDEAVYTALAEAYDKAINGMSSNLEDAQYATLLENLKAARELAEANKIPLSEGYYRIKVANPDVLGSNPSGDKLAWAHHTTNAGVISWGVDDGTADYIWQLTKAADSENYYIRNVSTNFYVQGLANPGWAAQITASQEPVTEHRIVSIDGLGSFNIYDAGYSECNYHALFWSSGEGLSGTICYADGNPSKWYLDPVDKAEVDALVAEALVQNRIDTLRSIISKAKDQMELASVSAYKFDEPVVTDAAQLSSNAQASPDDEPTCFENLIDGDLGTLFHSRYNSPEPIDDYHHLMVYAEKGLPAEFGIRWAKRCFNPNEGNNLGCRPTKIEIAVSNDGENWENTQILTTADGLPTLGTDTFYVSKKPIKGEGYKYFIMKVLEVNENWGMSDFYGHPFFTMSEYNLYPYAGLDPASYINDPEVKASIDAMNAAIAKAEEIIASRQITDESVPALQSAYDNLLYSWKDTTEVSRLILDARRFAALEAGDGNAVGDVPQSAIDKLASSLAESGFDKNNAFSVSKSQQADAIAKLTAMNKELISQITKPEAGRWYILQVGENNEERADNVMCPTGFNAASPLSDGAFSWLFGSAKIQDAATKDREHVVFTEAEDGRFIMQFVSSGAYNSPETSDRIPAINYQPALWYEPAAPLEIIPFGNGQVGFRTESGRYIRSHAAWSPNGLSYEYNPTNTYRGTHYAWKFVASDETVEEITTIQSIAQGRVMAITKPYELNGLPTIEYGVLQGYKIVGSVGADDDASMVTGFKLQAYDEDEIIPAGTPVIYIADGDTYDGGVKYDATFVPVMNGKVTYDVLTVNGLMSTLDNYFTQEDHMGYFLADSVVDEPINTLIGLQRAVIIPSQVKEIEGAEVDRIVYVKGAGMLNGITNAVVENPSETVSVYTIDGVRIRANVKRADALSGLAKGIYIVGKQKVFVK